MTIKEIEKVVENNVKAGKPLHGFMREIAIDMALAEMENAGNSQETE